MDIKKPLKQIVVETIERILKSPISSIFALIVCALTYAVYTKRLTAEEFLVMAGALATLYGLLKKDNDLK